MADRDNGIVRKVACSDLFRWLILVRCFRIAIQPRQLLLGAAGILVTAFTWTLWGLVFWGSPQVQEEIEPYHSCPWLAVTSAIPQWPAWMNPSDEASPHPSMVGVPRGDIHGGSQPLLNRGDHLPWGANSRWPGLFSAAWDPLWGSWEHLSRPLCEAFDLQGRPGPDGTPQQAGTLSRVTFLILCGLTAVAVWSFFGGAITRSAVLQLGPGQRDNLGATLRFTLGRWWSFLAAPIIPLAGVALITAVLAVPGLLLRANLGVALAGLIWPVLLAGGFFIVVLLLALVFGWPLLWASLASDEVDSFEAVSNMYRYVVHRPLNYLFYAIVAAVLGALGWLVVCHFTAGVVAATYWAASWGSNAQNVLAVIRAGDDLDGSGRFGAGLICFWAECVKLLGCGFLYSYFWTAVSGIYLLLRRDVDATELDEVVPEQEEEQPPPAPMPAVRTDSAGAPVIDDPEQPREDPTEQS
jgi:hypothetical protein